MTRDKPTGKRRGHDSPTDLPSPLKDELLRIGRPAPVKSPRPVKASRPAKPRLAASRPPASRPAAFRPAASRAPAARIAAGPPPTRPPGPPAKPRRWWRGLLLVIPAAVLVAGWMVLPVSAQERPCSWLATMKLSTIEESICDEQSTPLTQAAAEHAVDVYLNLLSGDDPEAAWAAEATGPALAATPPGEIGRTWGSVLWAERVGALVPDPHRRNTYQLRFLRYEGAGDDAGSGNLAARKQEITLVRQGQSVRVSGLGQLSWDGRPQDVDYTQVRVSADSDPTDFPWTSEPPLPPLAAGTQLSVLCQLQVSDPSPAGWWVRTPLGWVRSTALDRGRTGRADQPLDGVRTCQPRTPAT